LIAAPVSDAKIEMHERKFWIELGRSLQLVQGFVILQSLKVSLPHQEV
jgi:hypothetical protein